ncbi:MAG: cation-translocating P-type ATPase [Spirochaetales bacterium]|nr:cation-translocating P-type ATPase [Spirochaetales bacterium]
MSQWHQKKNDEVLNLLKTGQQGLSAEESAARLKKYGPNELIEKGIKKPWQILLDQLKEVMVLILIAAAVFSFAIGEATNAIVIMIIVVLNTILGFWQESKAEAAMAALKKLAVPLVRVKRGGKVQELSSRQLVPGDILILEAGNIIPADGRLLNSANLKVQEATLTGEAEAVNKDAEAVYDKDMALGDRKNMIFSGTVITYGRGEAVVTETAMNTELGKIASMLQNVEDEKTPLQKRLAKLGGTLSIAALVLIVLVAAISLVKGIELVETVLTSISMAVAAIPEGLPAVVTISLALGARKMLKNKSLIRNLPSVETLGSVTVICSDKTGTLTQNRMTVTQIVLDQEEIHMENALDKIKKGNNSLKLMLAAGTLCNDAVLNLPPGFEIDQAADGYGVIGDPTEGALVSAAQKAGLNKAELEKALPRVGELPFSSDRKRMTTVHSLSPALFQNYSFFKELTDKEAGYIGFIKGSADGLMEISSEILKQGEIKALSPEDKQIVIEQNEKMALKGIRVLAMAAKIYGSSIPQGEAMEKDIIFLGMAGMIDPVRPEAIEAVATCLKAGIRPVMITGDHPLTALHIAKELGITQKDEFLTGQDLSKLNIEELEEAAGRVSVYARVSPEHKMKLIDALQRKGQIVSMTGDGVNDAPALKSADIGVAMGITGTDVAKQSSDMVLLDDNFATIVRAVKEGRTIYDNIKRFIRYILCGNMGEILVMLTGPFMGLGLPLLPLQILWINLVTDGAPGIAMGYEAPEKDIMERPPYKPKESIFSRGIGRQIIWVGTLVAALCLGVGFYFKQTLGVDGPWQTALFTTMTFSQMLFALSARSNTRSFFASNPLTNPALYLAVGTTFILQLGLIYLPFLQNIFGTRELTGTQLLTCFVVSLVVLAATEIEKLILYLLKKAK